MKRVGLFLDVSPSDDYSAIPFALFGSSEQDKLPGIRNEYKHQDEFIARAGTVCVVDGASIGDIPTCYTIKGLLPHELPVKGTFIHPRIIPGFSYIVRPVDSNSKPLFNGKALCLEKIGIGYGKRLTFTGDSIHENDNYFWSDTNQEGYGFSLELVHVGDKFTILDIDNNPIGTLVVNRLMDFQKEIEESILSGNKLEKHATVSLRCNITYYEDSVESNDEITVFGIAMALKKVKSRAPSFVFKVKDCSINGQNVTLVPSTCKDIRKSKSLCGRTANDIPTHYSIAGLHRHELPVIGTFVDPRITPGFKYRVRLMDSKKHLFEGEALTLTSIGRGYGKRITFQSKSLKENDNFFWSDTNPQGYGFTLEAVSEGNSFKVVNSNGTEIGKASVFKLCGMQTELESTVKDRICTKKVKVSLACHILLNNQSDGITTRVKGIATLQRIKNPSTVQRIDELEFANLFNSHHNLNEIISFIKE